jgi:hypothetical protein
MSDEKKENEYDSLKKDNEINTNEKKENTIINFDEELNNIKNKAISIYEWNDLKQYFIEKYKSVIQEYNKIENENDNQNKKKIDETKNESPDINNLNTIQNIDEDIIYYLTNMKKMPFTLQRMAELLLEYNIYYKSAFKFNFAFKKLVNIDLD